MQRDRIRTLVTEQFYRTLGETGVNLDAIPHAQLQAIVTAMADGVFAALSALEEEGQASPAAPPSGKEEVLWEGKPYLSLGTRYELTSQRLRVFTGLFWRSMAEIELVRVRDTRVTQNIAERAFAVGDVTIVSSDPSFPEIVLDNIPEPMAVRERIREAVMKEQQRRGVRLREEV